jgi:TusA-related sulfurtransferase
MKIDACGLSCPQPVILTNNAMNDNESPIYIVVDTQCACENVQRLANNKGYQVEIEKSGEKFQMKLAK